MAECVRRDTCRLCLGKDLELVLQFVPIPIGDAYVSVEYLNKSQETYPVDLFLCHDCGHLQLLDVIDPELIYNHYIYHTSDSIGLVEHFRKYAGLAMHEINPLKDSLIVEIGSNDGTLLKFFQAYGMRVLGIDPARDIAKRATESGIDTLPDFFTVKLAKKIKKKYGSAAIVIANNVFANVDDLIDILEGIKELLLPNGVFILETGYLLDLIQKNIFDNIYHEHLSYFSVKPLESFFRRNGMELIDVKRTPTKGGSIRCTVQLTGGSRKQLSSVKELIKLETELNIHQSETFKALAIRVDKIKNQLINLLHKLKAEGKSIVGYGASIGVTMVLYDFGLDKEILDFLVDDNPGKQNLYSPGLHIPVLSSQTLYKQKIDYVLILAWQYSEPIIKKHQKYLDHGGHFITFLPKIEII